MSNKTATITVDMTYTGSGGTSISAPRKTISVPYQGYNEGLVDVPVGATAGLTYGVSFGSVGVEATAVRIDNNTTGAVAVHINGATVTSHSLAPGGSQMIAGPTDGSTDPLLSMHVALGATQVEVGTVAYWVFGDPV